MRRATVVCHCFILVGCGTFPLGYVHPMQGQDKAQQEHDTLYCKDQAHLAASTAEHYVGSFLLGLTIIGVLPAYAWDRSTQREVFGQCMAGRGYTVTSPDEVAGPAPGVPAAPAPVR